MKPVFYLLLVANVVYFAWNMRHLEPGSSVARIEMPMPGHVNRLLLLAELDQRELRARTFDASEEAPTPPANLLEESMDPSPGSPHAGANCFSIGPLTGEGEIEAVREWLGEQGAATTLRIDERRELALYWVYFPPFASRTEAAARAAGMKAEGIEDIFVIPGGDMSNAVSLGVYSRRTSLERRLRELKGKGYEPSVVPRYRTTRASWFDALFEVDYVFPQDEFTSEFPDAQASASACTSG